MNKIAFGLIGVVVIVLVLALALVLFLPRTAHPMFGLRHGGMMGGWTMGGFGILGAFAALGFVLLLGAGIVWLIQSSAGQRPQTHPPTTETSLEIINRRYASGEVTTKEYQEMKKELGV